MDFTKDIYINKDTVYENQEIVILYKGYLFSNNLTNDVYISYGYGNTWERQNEIKMKPSTFGYLATVKIDNGENLQFCFRDNSGNWDNNNQGNYILPIHESKEILSFETLADTSKKVTFEKFEQKDKQEEKPATEEEIFNPSIVSSNQVELYKTVDLDNITEQVIPDDTIITQINVNQNTEKILTQSIVKSNNNTESVSVAFSKLTDIAKQQSVKAFDDNNVTAGSVYVNSITKGLQDAPVKVENIDEKSLTIKKENSLSIVGSFIKLIFTSAKSALGKVVKLIKTSLQFGNDED